MSLSSSAKRLRKQRLEAKFPLATELSGGTISASSLQYLDWFEQISESGVQPSLTKSLMAQLRHWYSSAAHSELGTSHNEPVYSAMQTNYDGDLF